MKLTAAILILLSLTACGSGSETDQTLDKNPNTIHLSSDLMDSDSMILVQEEFNFCIPYDQLDGEKRTMQLVWDSWVEDFIAQEGREPEPREASDILIVDICHSFTY